LKGAGREKGRSNLGGALYFTEEKGEKKMIRENSLIRREGKRKGGKRLSLFFGKEGTTPLLNPRGRKKGKAGKKKEQPKSLFHT